MSVRKHRGVSDPLEVVAGEISDESILLCLDEFMVNDVADALVLNHFIYSDIFLTMVLHLFNNGAILVATSYRALDNLYEGGLQRDIFLPFIATLSYHVFVSYMQERCVIHEIGSLMDYRKRTSAEEGFFFVKSESDFLMQKFKELVGEQHTPQPTKWKLLWVENYNYIPLGANGCANIPFEEDV
ncbi:uncharacterized protein LOC143601635 [Bidens hawaiensis]|uniref:uncharacterized protein LOC143601635 n=1 Tax=Bidens hawaiensis TaxID=980011 RepID=UPI00404B00D0